SPARARRPGLGPHRLGGAGRPGPDPGRLHDPHDPAAPGRPRRPVPRGAAPPPAPAAAALTPAASCLGVLVAFARRGGRAGSSVGGMPIFHAGGSRARGRRLPHQVEVAVALLAAGVSLAPSLLPKTVLVQGLVTGIAAAAGYGAGAVLVVLDSPVRERVPAPLRDRGQLALLAVAALTLVPAAVA